MANKMLIKKAHSEFIIHFPDSGEEPWIMDGPRAIVEAVIGYFVPGKEAHRWHVVIDDPPTETGDRS